MKQGRELLSKNADEYPFDPSEITIKDEDTFALLEESVQEWWIDEFGRYVKDNDGFFTPPQREAIPYIHNEENTLVASPTGSGKTLSAFTSIINSLYKQEKEDGLDNCVYCLYISPLKSLTNDITRNVEKPLSDIKEILKNKGKETNIRQAIRHGDTPDSERSKMLDETPHILNTTPETLAILLNSPKFKKKLETVQYVVVDEIHSLAESKRGTHLSVSLERLENMTEQSPVRIGCSATVEPLDTVGKFLVGMDEPDRNNYRDYNIVDTRFVRDYDIKVSCPTDDLIHTDSSVVSSRFYDTLHEHIQNHTNTLVFTNARSGAERVLENLRRDFDEYDEENSGCHHGSMSKEKREEIESKLKDGTIDVVTTSTSLELGIDMPDIDLVIQVGSPKSVSSLLQRIGRAGHRLGQTVTGRIIVLDRDELVECSVMAKRAEEGFIDRVFIPQRAQDVLSQHVYGIAINSVRPEKEVKEIVKSAYPYRNYTDHEWEQLMKYLTASYDGMNDKNVYAKIWRDVNDKKGDEHHYPEYDVGENLIGKRGKMARVIYMTNIGTIPDSFSVSVYTRGSDEWVGKLDEEYLNTLEKGDVFVLAGNRYEYKYRRGSKVYVDRTTASPNVPSWFSERLPLSYDLGSEILKFQNEFRSIIQNDGVSSDYFSDWPIDENSATSLVRMYEEQIEYTGAESISTPNNLFVEEELDSDENRRYYYIHSNYGRKFNDGLSRIIAYNCSQEIDTNVKIAVSDHGFTLSVPKTKNPNMKGIIEELDADNVRTQLRKSLHKTDLLKRYFRINATRSLMILRNYKGRTKSAKQQQVTSEMMLGYSEDLDDFAVLEETYREIMEDKLAISEVEYFVDSVQNDTISVNHKEVPTPSPRAFGLASLMVGDAVLADNQSTVLQDFHRRMSEEIEK